MDTKKASIEEPCIDSYEEEDLVLDTVFTGDEGNSDEPL